MPHIQQDTSLQQVKAATRLAMANRDLLEADSYLRALANQSVTSDVSDNSETINKSLLSSAIVAYCRPFGGNNGAGIATSQISISSFSSVDVALHQKLMHLRNQAVAHADADVVPVQLLDHDQSDLMVVAELPFDLFAKVSPEAFQVQIESLLEQVQKKLHDYSGWLRAIPGALGPKIKITVGELSDEP